MEDLFDSRDMDDIFLVLHSHLCRKTIPLFDTSMSLSFKQRGFENLAWVVTTKKYMIYKGLNI